MFRSRPLTKLASAALMTGVVLGVLAGPAAASTAQVVTLFDGFPCKYNPDCPPSPPDTALVYLGGGEANRVSVGAAGQRISVGDSAAQIEPGPGCSRVDAHNVSCEVPKILVYVATGAGSDRVRSELGPATALIADGGAGDDLLVGGAGPDTLLAGRGSDRLRGRGGDDRLFDASPRDPLRAGDQSPLGDGADLFRGPALSPGRGRDSFDGGDGSDTLSYKERSANLRIDLASRKPVSGARRERDSIKGVENAIGGSGNDRIAGSGRANRLQGDDAPSAVPAGKGNDRIDGRAGPDSIEGGGGSNVLIGGPGNDTLAAGTRTSCGSGTDSVGDFGPTDFVSPDCEQPRFDFLDALLGGPLEVNSLLPLRRGNPPVVLSGRLGCFLDSVCQVTAEVRVRGRGTRRGTAPPRGTLLGSHAFTIGVREVKSLDLRLSAAGLRALRRHRALRVSVSLATQYSDGPTSYLTLLRSP